MNRICSYIVVVVTLVLLSCCKGSPTLSQDGTTIPYIKSLEKVTDLKSLETALQKGGALTLNIDKINWPDRFSYAPVTTASLAYSQNYLAVLYHVEGYDLRTLVSEDNGPVCQDSCCEIFIMSQDGKNYYNVEMNAAGIIHSALGPDINSREYKSQEELDRILRFCSIPTTGIEQNDSMFAWEAAMMIPLDVIGIDSDNIPESISCNLYKCADKTSHQHYVTWMPVGTERPNFHSPAYFGELKLGRR